MDFFFYHLTSIQLLQMQLPALKTSRLPWCAMQTDAQPPTLANSKCGLGDGDESDLEWLEAETPRQVNIWTAASAGWAQANEQRLLLHFSPDWRSPQGKGRGATFSATGRQAQWHSWHLSLGCQPKSPLLCGRWWMWSPKSGGSHISWGIASSAEA